METLNKIVTEIATVLDKVNESDFENISQKIMKSKRIFVVGEGRSGLMAKSFAMRLMHLGATVYVVGETITPSIAEGDLLVAVSGSGKTQNVVLVSKKTKALHCEVIAVTTDPNSPLANHATDILNVPGATKYRKDNEMESIQPLGSLFDQSVHILFDAICLLYAEQKSVNHKIAFKQHSNLE